MTAIFAGLSVAYARTKTFSGSTIRDWKYTITGNYNESNGAVSGTTSSTFSVHKGCYTEAEAYELNFDKKYAYGKDEDNYVSCSGNAGKNNKKVRVRHNAYSKKGACIAGGHTIY